MAVEVTAQVWAAQVHWTQKLVLLALAWHADPGTLRAWPSIRELAQKTQLSERAVQLALRALERAGDLTTTPGGGRARRSVYTLNPERYSVNSIQRIQYGECDDAKPRTGEQKPAPSLSPIPSIPPKGKRQETSAQSAYALPAGDQPAPTRKNGADLTPAVIGIPLTDGTEYQVTQAFADELATLYPAVDVAQTLREIRGWNLTHPNRRKTRRGITAHINAWLSKEQNRGP